MKIELSLAYRDDTIATRVIAQTREEIDNPIPLLERAIAELRWQMDNYALCPVHAK